MLICASVLSASLLTASLLVLRDESCSTLLLLITIEPHPIASSPRSLEGGAPRFCCRRSDGVSLRVDLRFRWTHASSAVDSSSMAATSNSAGWHRKEPPRLAAATTGRSGAPTVGADAGDDRGVASRPRLSRAASLMRSVNGSAAVGRRQLGPTLMRRRSLAVLAICRLRSRHWPLRCAGRCLPAPRPQPTCRGQTEPPPASTPAARKRTRTFNLSWHDDTQLPAHAVRAARCQHHRREATTRRHQPPRRSPRRARCRPRPRPRPQRPCARRVGPAVVQAPPWPP